MNPRASERWPESRMCVREDEWMGSRRAYFGECVTRSRPTTRMECASGCASPAETKSDESVRSFRFTRNFKLPHILRTNHPNINDEQKRFSSFLVVCDLRFISSGLRFLLFRTNSLLPVILLIIINYCILDYLSSNIFSSQSSRKYSRVNLLVSIMLWFYFLINEF